MLSDLVVFGISRIRTTEIKKVCSRTTEITKYVEKEFQKEFQFANTYIVGFILFHHFEVCYSRFSGDGHIKFFFDCEAATIKLCR